MHRFLFKFTLVLNSVLLLWRLLVFEFLLGTLKIFLLNVCSSSKNCPSASCASAANIEHDHLQTLSNYAVRYASTDRP
jgi:hypothetical protein